MEKLAQIWKDWKGSIGFAAGALVVSTTFWTCTIEPNTDAIKEEVLKDAPKIEKEPPSSGPEE